MRGLGALSNSNNGNGHSSFSHGALGDSSQPQTPIGTLPGLFISTSHQISAPSTPHGSGIGLLGGVRRSISDNALMNTPQGAAPLGNVATPTSARRLPIFSSLADTETA